MLLYSAVLSWSLTGSRLKKLVRAPRILHISTRGFSPEERSESKAARGPLDLKTGSVAITGRKLLQLTENPLLTSGLVLAGANKIEEALSQITTVDDGWVTAHEVSMINLQGTELVVLSACGTGLGEVSAGEGVYGLRRAFQNAGAQTIISTLFEVSDQESRELVGKFYEALKSGKSKMAALHEAQLQILQQHRREREGAAHPFFWAGFVLTGNAN